MSDDARQAKGSSGSRLLLYRAPRAELCDTALGIYITCVIRMLQMYDMYDKQSTKRAWQE